MLHGKQLTFHPCFRLEIDCIPQKGIVWGSGSIGVTLGVCIIYLSPAVLPIFGWFLICCKQWANHISPGYLLTYSDPFTYLGLDCLNPLLTDWHQWNAAIWFLEAVLRFQIEIQSFSGCKKEKSWCVRLSCICRENPASLGSGGKGLFDCHTAETIGEMGWDAEGNDWKLHWDKYQAHSDESVTKHITYVIQCKVVSKVKSE